MADILRYDFQIEEANNSTLERVKGTESQEECEVELINQS